MVLTRTIEDRVIFKNPFKIPGTNKLIPSGSYRINIMQELLEGLSFVAYRKTAIILYIPINNSQSEERSIIFEPKDFDTLIQGDKISKTDLFYRIKAKIDENTLEEQNFGQDIRSEIERAENEGMYIQTT